MNRYRLTTDDDETLELELTRGAYCVLRGPLKRVTAAAPRIGDRPLHEVPTSEWKGARLTVGPCVTAPLTAVEKD